MSKIIDITGNKYERLIVEKMVEPQISKTGKRKTRWLCKCDCGNKIIVSGTHLKDGHVKSCGCLNRELASKRQLIDLIGLRFGKLVVVERADSYRKGKQIKTMWKCNCDCGGYVVTYASSLKRGLVKVVDVLTHGEKSVYPGCCEKKDVHYDTQYAFDDCRLNKKTSRRLRFDFAIKNSETNELIGLIEYNGEQHLLTYNASNFGETQRKITDDIKIQYCQEHDIPLFTIWFYDDVEKMIDVALNYIYSYRRSIPCQASIEEGVTTIPDGSTR